MSTSLLDQLEIPDFLKVDAAEQERRRLWWEKNPPAKQTFSTVQSKTNTDINAAYVEEATDDMMDIGVRAKLEASQAKADARKKNKEDRYVKKTQRGKCGSKDEGSSTFDPKTMYWDATAGKMRPIGYMSAAKYQARLAYMPDDAHRAAFIKMFGGTQPAGKREMDDKTAKRIRLLQQVAQQRSGPAAPDKREKKVDAVIAAGGKLSKSKSQNPDQVAKVAAMMRRPEGATLPEIGAAMGWQTHSASAFLTRMRQNAYAIARTPERRGEPSAPVYKLIKE